LFKLGVYRLDQFRALQRGGVRASLYSLLTRGRISLQLLAADAPPAEKLALFEKAIPGIVQLSGGVWRTTFPGRFRELDGWVDGILGSQFDSSAPLDVQDWAASDCSTSAEWAATLFARFPNARLTASDLTLFVLEAQLPGGDAFILEPSGAALQYIHPPFVVRLNPPERRWLLWNGMLCRRALARARELWRQWAIPMDWLGGDGQTLEQPPYRFRKILLIHPQADALRRRSSRFTVRKHSAFDPLAEPADVIRTMNIFNPSYFDKTRLSDGARNVWRSLRPGGIWIVGRTWQDNPPRHRASVFQRQDGGFQLLERYEDGSEIDDIVLAAQFSEMQPG